MKWEVVLVCSVYERAKWNNGLLDDARPVREHTFCSPLGNAQDGPQVAAAIGKATRRAEAWLLVNGTSLVTHIVVTVYSLEVL